MTIWYKLSGWQHCYGYSKTHFPQGLKHTFACKWQSFTEKILAAQRRMAKLQQPGSVVERN